MKLLYILIIPLISGCFSTPSSETRPKTYNNTITDLEIHQCYLSNEPGWGLAGTMRLPFSFTVETVLLPYTIYLDCTAKAPSSTKKSTTQCNIPKTNQSEGDFWRQKQPTK